MRKISYRIFVILYQLLYNKCQYTFFDILSVKTDTLSVLTDILSVQTEILRVKTEILSG